MTYEEDESEELVDLSKLTEGKDWKREEGTSKRKKRAKGCTHAARAHKAEEPRARMRDMIGRDVEVFGDGKWRSAIVKSFCTEKKQVIYDTTLFSTESLQSMQTALPLTHTYILIVAAVSPTVR